MKRLWLALVAVAALCLGSWAGAEDCEHYTSCIGSGTCYFCGVDGWFASIHAHVNIMNVGRGHLVECTDCGVMVEQGPHTYVDGACEICDALQSECPHYVFCDRPTVCLDCGTEDVQEYEQMEHREKNTYVDIGDDKKHSVRCSGCGAELKTEYHAIEFKSISKAEHLAYCIECGCELQYQSHQVICTDAFCIDCGEQNYEIYCICHMWQYVDLGNKHQFQCNDCGSMEQAFYHEVFCIDPGFCVLCELHVADDLTRHEIACEKPTTCRKCGSTVEGYSREKMIHKAETLQWNEEYGETAVCGNCKICVRFADGISYRDGGYWFFQSEHIVHPGDANSNSSVTIDDAIAILAGTVSSEANADVTGDGKVNAQDALRIMQYLAGWDVTLQ